MVFCIEDGVEQGCEWSFNMVLQVHFMKYPHITSGKFMSDVHEESDGDGDGTGGNRYGLLPERVDVTASAFFILNPYNKFIGNAASGGWGGHTIVTVTEPFHVSI
ncbi:hypothetical protein OAN61_00905 [bacterium]|nr:hypothetical protein [bacterium]